MWLEERMLWQAFTADSVCLNVYDYAWDSIPVLSDDEIAAKLARLNDLSPFDLRYNRYVQAFINLYAIQRREVTSRVLGMAALYYPLFEEKLDQFDMPLELKHLAVVESALNPIARSRVGATGLWQFMYNTGKMYGLQVDTYIDERRDPIKSTIAACRYMLFLHGMYNDWNLVLAAYNAGPGNVNKAIRRSGGKRDYWSIRPFLPRETRGYVPAFIAVNYVMNHAADHNIYPSMPSYLFSEIDTVHICRETTFNQISHITGTEISALEILNPSLKRNFVPNNDQCIPVYMPIDAIGTFVQYADSLYKLPDLGPQPINGFIYEDIVETHIVRRGEVLGLIAQRHGVGLSQLREWNNIRGNNIYPGQRLAIHKTVKRAASTTQNTNSTAEVQKGSGAATPTTKAPAEDEKSAASQASAKNEQAKPSVQSNYHIVQRGDTLWDIAKKYPGISANDIIKANSGVSSKSLKPGQKLTIPPAS